MSKNKSNEYDRQQEVAAVEGEVTEAPKKKGGKPGSVLASLGVVKHSVYEVDGLTFAATKEGRKELNKHFKVRLEQEKHKRALEAQGYVVTKA